ncbi:uncharacterized protein LOC124898805 [Capsicum annuum]|uniref:uncharacterized protein LOC124898805 n=1 Tax=Capsicum annuum TaxID=4072 RepID=UPI001FB07E6E|nr:uncharacterized protein LOC124898805 [Capsicum annuum]
MITNTLFESSSLGVTNFDTIIKKLEHKALSVLKYLNLSWKQAADLRLAQLNEMDEFHLWVYERTSPYKERMKLYHERRIEKREFQVGDLVLLFNSRFKLFPGNLKSKWFASFKVTQAFASGVIGLENRDVKLIKVNAQRIKQYVRPKRGKAGNVNVFDEV